MAEKPKVVDILNYFIYHKTGFKKFFFGPESSFLLRPLAKLVPNVEDFPSVTTAEFVKQMDEAGYDKVFLAALKMGSYRTRAINIDYPDEMIYEEVKQFPDRLVGISGYDPLFVMDSVRGIEKAVKEYGFKGVYAHTLGWGIAANDRRMYPCYAKCVELDIPFSMQIGQSYEPLPSEPGRPIYVDQVALDFPELRFVCSHTGYPWVEECVAVAWTRENVYIDTAAHNPRTFPARMKPLLDFMDTGLGRTKVIYGTNGFGLKNILDEFMALPLKDKSRSAILWENAIRVYKL